MAGGADCIHVPERRFDVHDVCALIQKRIQRGRKFAIVVVAEGAKPEEKHGPIAHGTALMNSVMNVSAASANGSANRLRK